MNATDAKAATGQAKLYEIAGEIYAGTVIAVPDADPHEQQYVELNITSGPTAGCSVHKVEDVTPA
jgi:hypothetical protein